MATSQTSESTIPPMPDSIFTIDPSLAAYDLPAKQWLLINDKHWDGLATGCIVFNSKGHVLLVQRAAHDSMPNKWEIPGGAVDDEDASLFAGAARELWEEAGLVALRFTYVVSEGEGVEPGSVFPNSKGTRIWCRICFIVQISDANGDGEGSSTGAVKVKLDPNEHQDYVWASEEQIREQKIVGADSCLERDLPITTNAVRQVILEAFRLHASEHGGL